VASLFEEAWRRGADLPLPELIQAIQRPPLDRVGVLELEAFYPERDRFQLAMAVNNLLAAPGFAVWMQGEPLDAGRLLFDDTGRPRVAVLSIAHLSESQRMFFLSLLLTEFVGWVRRQPGTSSLRALLYMDEIFGYLPPVSEPPSKRPLLTLMKQARAHGVGLVLATQNPVDLDYKALSNAGSWFVGRLQTERDRDRLLDGLAGIGVDRAELERLLSGLDKRIFLLHNVHEDEPVLFQTRWALSYLRGPMTRDELRRLTARAGLASPATVETVTVGDSPPEATMPILPPEIEQRFLPGGATERLYAARLVAAATVHFVSPRHSFEAKRTSCMLVPFAADGGADWEAAEELSLTTTDLALGPTLPARFEPLPAAAAQPRSYPTWRKELAEHLYRTARLELLRSAVTGHLSLPGEDERSFRIRLQQLGREERDAAVEALRERCAKRLDAAGARLERAAEVVERERDEASGETLQTAISMGAALVASLLGRRRLSSTSLGKVTTAARGWGRARQQGADVDRAEGARQELERRYRELGEEMKTEIAALQNRIDPATEELVTEILEPRRSDVQVEAVYLGWQP
jgi:hypothetical protein